jgi:hypothetical protein
MLNKPLRSLTVALLLAAGIWASACGGSDTTVGNAAGAAGSGTSGNAGSAGSSGSSSGSAGTGGMVDVTCGNTQCVHAGVSSVTFAACCPTGTSDTCGLDSSLLAMYGPSFPDPCLPLHQPGVLDTSCPDRQTMVSGFNLTFPGCCRADTGTCGYNLDSAGGLVTLGLGCVDSTPFLDGGTPLTCGDGGIGNAGAGP